MSVAAYAASRPAPVPGVWHPLHSESITLLDTTSQFAAREMHYALIESPDTNPLVSPPLVVAHASLLADTAQGDTLSQINQAMPTVIDGPLVVRHLKDVVTRNVWGQAGSKFAVSFLQRTPPSSYAELSAWYPTTA